MVMRPGWHVFSGVDALLWDPGSFASGNYSVTSEMFLFPSAETGTPYGVFLGGGQLEGESFAYISFQLRNDRRFRVAQHAGGRNRGAHSMDRTADTCRWSSRAEGLWRTG